jgi:hypothetical protein
MVTRRRLALAVVMMIMGALVACSSIWGFDDLTLLPDASTDARADSHPPDVIDAPSGDADASPDSKPEGDATEAACVPALPPMPPVIDDDGGADATFVFALHTIDLGLKAGDLVGYDLDTVCTCPGPSSCKLPAATADGQACDRPGGRDNAAAVLFKDLAMFDSNLSQASLNDDINQGQFTVLVQMRDYNGSANDSNVTLEFFNSPGSEGKPAWEGSDSWEVYNDNVASGDPDSGYIGRFIDFKAYVTNYTIVAHFPPSLTIRLRPDTGGNHNYLELPLAGSVLTADLDPTNPAGSIATGAFSARMSSNNLLAAFRVLENGGTFLCGDSGLYSLLASEVCPARDIMDNPNQDNKGDTCNGLSFALAFTAVPAHFGALFTPAQVPPECPDGWSPTCGM